MSTASDLKGAPIRHILMPSTGKYKLQFWNKNDLTWRTIPNTSTYSSKQNANAGIRRYKEKHPELRMTEIAAHIMASPIFCKGIRL